MEAPGALVVTRFPSVIVPVCVVKGVSAAGVLNEAPRVREAACARETARVSEQPCVSERPSVRVTACVSSLYVREMAVGMREGTTACPSAMVECVSIRARENVRVRVRQRRCLTRDKGRVAAVAISSTVPGLHSSECGVRAVLRTRLPRARLRR